MDFGKNSNTSKFYRWAPALLFILLLLILGYILYQNFTSSQSSVPPPSAPPPVPSIPSPSPSLMLSSQTPSPSPPSPKPISSPSPSPTPVETPYVEPAPTPVRTISQEAPTANLPLKKKPRRKKRMRRVEKASESKVSTEASSALTSTPDTQAPVEARVSTPELRAPELAPSFNDHRKKFFFLPSLRISDFIVHQTGVPSLSEKMISLQIRARYLLDESSWKLGARGVMTLLPFGSSWNGVTARTYDADLQLTRDWPLASSQWKISLSAGVYFSTMTAKDDFLGYRNILGPQLYPTLTYQLDKTDELSLSFKYSPIVNGYSFLNLNNREMNVELEWRTALSDSGDPTDDHPVDTGKSFSITAEYQEVSLNAQNNIQTTLVHAQSFGVSIGYHW